MTPRIAASTSILVTLAFAIACADSDTPADAGDNPDASAMVRPDATGADALPAPDAPAPDAAATPDAGSPDAETPPDTGAPDGGAPAAPAIHTFSAGGHDRLFGVAFDSANNLVAVGVTSTGTNAPDLETVVVRFRPDGTLDPTFGTNGVFRRNLVVGGAVETARGIVIQSDGRIVISAAVERARATDPRDADVALLRLTRTGTVDASFGEQGLAIVDLGEGAVSGNNWVGDVPWALALGGDDAIVLSATRKSPGRSDSDFVIAKLTSRGALDRSFANGGIFELDIDNRGATARSPTVLGDGSILGSGYMSADGVVTPVIYKLTPAGVLDERFAARGVFNTSILSAVTESYGVVALPSGALVSGGYGRELANGTNDFLAIGLTAAGQLDRGFGDDGATVVDIAELNLADNCRDLLALPDGRTVHIGNGRTSASNGDAVVMVLTASGAPDRSFGRRGVRTYDLGGPADVFWDLARAPDGRVGVVGVRGPVAADGDDDAAVLVLPAP